MHQLCNLKINFSQNFAKRISCLLGKSWYRHFFNQKNQVLSKICTFFKNYSISYVSMYLNLCPRNNLPPAFQIFNICLFSQIKYWKYFIFIESVTLIILLKKTTICISAIKLEDKSRKFGTTTTWFYALNF